MKNYRKLSKQRRKYRRLAKLLWKSIEKYIIDYEIHSNKESSDINSLNVLYYQSIKNCIFIAIIIKVLLLVLIIKCTKYFFLNILHDPIQILKGFFFMRTNKYIRQFRKQKMHSSSSTFGATAFVLLCIRYYYYPFFLLHRALSFLMCFVSQNVVKFCRKNYGNTTEFAREITVRITIVAQKQS